MAPSANIQSVFIIGGNLDCVVEDDATYPGTGGRPESIELRFDLILEQRTLLITTDGAEAVQELPAHLLPAVLGSKAGIRAALISSVANACLSPRSATRFQPRRI